MKLQLHIDTPEEGDPQSQIPPDSIKDVVRIRERTSELRKFFEDELPLFFPKADQYDEVEISVSFVNSAEMRIINKDYRDMDEATDVLTFPLWDEGGEFIPSSALPGLLPLGDILICPEETARKHDFPTALEGLCLVLAHGFLHLLAWDHDTPEKEEDMWARQDLLKTKLLDILKEAA